ncbi:hypothetical protein GGF31_001624 [Allomyces arbusculus]|nr:hypothetical protein GGF31_001624 [Allomyces arbusculus]
MADRAPKRRRVDSDSNENDGDLPPSRAALRTAVTKALNDEAAMLREVAGMILGELRHLMVEQDQLRAILFHTKTMGALDASRPISFHTKTMTALNDQELLPVGTIA